MARLLDDEAGEQNVEFASPECLVHGTEAMQRVSSGTVSAYMPWLRDQLGIFARVAKSFHGSEA